MMPAQQPAPLPEKQSIRVELVGGPFDGMVGAVGASAHTIQLPFPLGVAAQTPNEFHQSGAKVAATNTEVAVPSPNPPGVQNKITYKRHHVIEGGTVAFVLVGLEKMYDKRG